MRNIIIFALFCLILTGCVTQEKSLYSWNNYQALAYEYVKTGKTADYDKLMQTLQVMIDKQTGSRQTVPPGICADYGYLLYKNGKKEEGLAYLKKEVALYPESAVFVSRIIKNIENEND